MAEERTDRERLKAIELAVGQIEKQFGKGSIMRLGQQGAIQPIPAISTGSISLDYALGIGGVPRGRVIEIFGPESSGKTTLALQMIAAGAEDGRHGRLRGRRARPRRPVRAEARRRPRQPARVAARQRRAGARDRRGPGASAGVDVVVVDSVAALVPRAEIEGEMGDAQVGLQARLMSQALRKLTGVVSKSKTA